MLENEPPFWSRPLNKICAQNTFQCFDFKTSTKKKIPKKKKLNSTNHCVKQRVEPSFNNPHWKIK